MAVNIIWSDSNGGDAIEGPIEHGNVAVGSASTPVELFLRHDGNFAITNCGFYIASTDAYSHAPNIVSWGTASGLSFGGFQLNMDATNSYPTWPTDSSKYGNGYSVVRSGAGDSSAHAITLPITMGLTGTQGTIQTGASPNVRFKCRIVVPTLYGSVGPYVEFKQKLRFTFTS